MDVREKLAFSICNATQKTNYKCDFKCEKKGKCAYCLVMAEQMIAHGVTVQEWISVKDERKPKYGEDVLVVVFDGYDTYADTDCLMRDGKWCFETENHKVTHWQPMPQPPKGE